MRVLLAMAVALLALNFADEQLNDGAFSRAAQQMVVEIGRSVGL
jgi:hypothetical protein